jgi:hypothetical protein
MQDNNESKEADMEQRKQGQRGPAEGTRGSAPQGKQPGRGRQGSGESRETGELVPDEETHEEGTQGEQERRSRLRNPEHPSRPDEAIRDE